MLPAFVTVHFEMVKDCFDCSVGECSQRLINLVRIQKTASTRQFHG